MSLSYSESCIYWTPTGFLERHNLTPPLQGWLVVHSDEQWATKAALIRYLCACHNAFLHSLVDWGQIILINIITRPPSIQPSIQCKRPLWVTGKGKWKNHIAASHAMRLWGKIEAHSVLVLENIGRGKGNNHTGWMVGWLCKGICRMHCRSPAQVDQQLYLWSCCLCGNYKVDFCHTLA